MEPRQFTTIEQARAWIVEQFGRWATRPTQAHLQALLAYKSNGFRLINRSLREDSATRFDAPLHLAITEAIAAEAITEAVQVYRGISDPQIVELVQLQAEQIDHKGFASVSLLHRVATDFGTDAPVGVVLVAALPIGTQAAPLDLIPGAPFANEAELLLHAGAAFVIDDVNDDNPRLIIARGHWRFP